VRQVGTRTKTKQKIAVACRVNQAVVAVQGSDLVKVGGGTLGDVRRRQRFHEEGACTTQGPTVEI
jgi:hypothetical protein